MATNSTTLTGNLTRDPEMKVTTSGTPLVNFGVAVNRRWQNRTTQEWEEQVSFFDCVAWQDLAANIAETLAKGDRVVLTGRLDQRSWENDEGEKRSKVEITVDEIGASLRFATAAITKNEKKESGARDGAPDPSDPFA